SYLHLFANLSSSSVLARCCSTILTEPTASAASAPVKSFLSSPCTERTDPKVTFSPTLPSTRSIRMVSPGATRYCFPPVLITAYIDPPGVKDKLQLYGAIEGASTWVLQGFAARLRLATND